MAYHWTDSSPWHAQQRRQRLEGDARRAAARARNLAEANAKIAELEDEVARLKAASQPGTPEGVNKNPVPQPNREG